MRRQLRCVRAAALAQQSLASLCSTGSVIQTNMITLKIKGPFNWWSFTVELPIPRRRPRLRNPLTQPFKTNIGLWT